jgi:hypothetical protein
VDARDQVPARTTGSHDGLRSVVFVVYGPIVEDDIPGLCRRVRALFDGEVDQVVCDVGALVAPDGVTLDALARLQLAARRRGIDLLGLLDAAGLSDIVPLAE